MDDQKLAIERFDKALVYVDRLLPLLPPFAHFNTSAIILSSNWTKEDKHEANSLCMYINTLLKDRLKYAQEQNGDFWTELNEIGQAAQKAGGHFVYIKSLDDKTTADKDRQTCKDQSDKLDLLLKKWQVKTKYLPYIVSFIALAFSILSYFKPEKKQADLQLMQQQIQGLQHHVKLQDSLFRADTLWKNRK